MSQVLITETASQQFSVEEIDHIDVQHQEDPIEVHAKIYIKGREFPNIVPNWTNYDTEQAKKLSIKMNVIRFWE